MGFFGLIDIAGIASGVIALFRAELDLGAFQDALAIDVPKVEDRFPIAEMACRFHLFDRIGKLHQSFRAREEMGAKIGTKSIADDGEIKKQGQLSELVYDLWC